MEQNELQQSQSAWEQLGRVRNYLESGIRPTAERVRIDSLISAQQIIDHARRQCEPLASPPQPTPTPLESLPRYQRDTEWNLRFGPAGPSVKRLKEIEIRLRTESTPEFHSEREKLIHFLWSKHPDVAEELALPKAETHAPQKQPSHGEPDEHDRTVAAKKAAAPEKYPTMAAREVAAYLGLSIKSVYDHPGLQPVSTGTRRRLWTTASVLAVRNTDAE